MAKHGEVKFLGSYPTMTRGHEEKNSNAASAWNDAQDWIDGLRRQIDTA